MAFYGIMKTPSSIIEKMNNIELYTYLEMLEGYLVRMLEGLLEEMPKSNKNRSSNQRSERGLINKIQIVIDNFNAVRVARRVYSDTKWKLESFEKGSPLRTIFSSLSTKIVRSVMKALIERDAETNTQAAVAMIVDWDEEENYDYRGSENEFVENSRGVARDVVRNRMRGVEDVGNTELLDWLDDFRRYVNEGSRLSEEEEIMKANTLETIISNTELVQQIRTLIQATILAYIDYRDKSAVLRQSLKNLYSSKLPPQEILTWRLYERSCEFPPDDYEYPHIGGKLYKTKEQMNSMLGDWDKAGKLIKRHTSKNRKKTKRKRQKIAKRIKGTKRRK